MIKDIKTFCGYCEFAENCEKHYFECDKHKVLAEIATDQRKIDIEKACDVYSKELKEIINILNKVGEMRGIEELGDILSYDGCLRDFRKAMEEKQ